MRLATATVGPMRIGYGYLMARHHPDDARSDAEIYREAIDAAVELDGTGIDSIWTSARRGRTWRAPISPDSIRASRPNRAASSPTRCCRSCVRDRTGWRQLGDEDLEMERSVVKPSEAR
jgi:hypothetical protein